MHAIAHCPTSHKVTGPQAPPQSLVSGARLPVRGTCRGGPSNREVDKGMEGTGIRTSPFRTQSPAHQALYFGEDHRVIGVEQPARGALAEAKRERDEVDHNYLQPESRRDHELLAHADLRDCTPENHRHKVCERWVSVHTSETQARDSTPSSLSKLAKTVLSQTRQEQHARCMKHCIGNECPDSCQHKSMSARNLGVCLR